MLLSDFCVGCHLVFNSSGSGDDSLDSLSEHVPRCPLTPSLSPQKRTTSQSKTEPPLLRTNKRTIYTAGRPPWYNVTGTTFKEAFVIGEKSKKRSLFCSSVLYVYLTSVINMDEECPPTSHRTKMRPKYPTYSCCHFEPVVSSGVRLCAGVVRHLSHEVKVLPVNPST